MRKFIPGSLIFTLPALILLVFSCTPESCFEETTSFLNATFYETGSDKPTIADSITVYGIGKETTKIYNKALKVSKIKLPLDASSGSSGFVIKINDITDTLILFYSSFPHLISKECGITFYYTLDPQYSVSGSKVDTIIFRNNNITTLNEENISIFY
jgi:hypothetical protein